MTFEEVYRAALARLEIEPGSEEELEQERAVLALVPDLALAHYGPECTDTACEVCAQFDRLADAPRWN